MTNSASNRWALAIFAARESVVDLRASVKAAIAAAHAPLVIDVLINGNPTLAADFAKSFPGAVDITGEVEVRIWFLPFGDKAHAWNDYLHRIWSGEPLAFFMDGYVRPRPDSIGLLGAAVLADAVALGGSGVPNVGRTSKQLRGDMLAAGGIHGNFCCIKGAVIQQLKDRKIRLPVGLYRADGLVGALLTFGLDRQRHKWEPKRVLIHPDVTWDNGHKHWWNIDHLQSQFKRAIRQYRGVIENCAIRNHFTQKALTPEELPARVDQLVVAWAANSPAEYRRLYLRHPLCLLAMRYFRLPRDYSKVNEPPQMLWSSAALAFQTVPSTELKTPRVLFVTPASPFSMVSGAEQRSTLIRQALGQVGQVDVLQLNQGPKTRAWRQGEGANACVFAEVQISNRSINRYGPKHDLTRAVEQEMGVRLDDYDVIVGRYIWPVCQLEVSQRVPIVVDMDDWRYRYSDEASWSTATALERLGKAISHHWARRQICRFAGAFAVSEQDQRELPLGLPSVYLPNIPLNGATHFPQQAKGKRLLFVGSLWYRPNVEGINWFLRQVWPGILAAEPQATLSLVGAAAKGVRAAWAQHPGVTASGFANDLAAAYAGATLVIVPIHSGGGTNIKILEAMAHGKPCLVTPLTAQAFGKHLQEGKHFLVGHCASDFVEKTLAVLRAPAHFEPMAKLGYDAIHAQFTRAGFHQKVIGFLEDILGRSTNGHINGAR